MKKRGFTLIELLAVIVILAIIALIATPIVMNVIENSKKGAAERSADNYLRAVETAIATERLDGNILEGEYTIQSDGNLCPATGCGENDIDKVTIDMSGNKPTSGTINISNGVVSTSSTMTVGEYTVSYNTEGNLEASKETESVAMYTLDYIQGQTEDDIIKYDPVANSKCESGDTCYSWYVLEDGDLTTLTDGRIAPAGKVSLIMDKNINEDTVAWCTTGSDNSCAADGAIAYLESQTTGWNVNLDVSLPTYNQIFVINDSETITNIPWLYDYLDGTTNSVADIYGYWTSTPHADSTKSSIAWTVDCEGKLMTTYVSFDHSTGIRPVITISKDSL